jgi:hypothetical protein
MDNVVFMTDPDSVDRAGKRFTQNVKGKEGLVVSVFAIETMDHGFECPPECNVL